MCDNPLAAREFKRDKHEKCVLANHIVLYELAGVRMYSSVVQVLAPRRCNTIRVPYCTQ